MASLSFDWRSPICKMCQACLQGRQAPLFLSRSEILSRCVNEDFARGGLTKLHEAAISTDSGLMIDLKAAGRSAWFWLAIIRAELFVCIFFRNPLSITLSQRMFCSASFIGEYRGVVPLEGCSPKTPDSYYLILLACALPPLAPGRIPFAGTSRRGQSRKRSQTSA